METVVKLVDQDIKRLENSVLELVLKNNITLKVNATQNVLVDFIIRWIKHVVLVKKIVSNVPHQQIV